MSTVADYVGRTVDFLAFPDAEVGKEVLVSQILVKDGERGEITAGVQKLAQRWLIEFLTIRGSMRALPNRGSQFINDIRVGKIRTTLDAEQSFYLSAAQVKRQLVLEESASDPADERFRSIELISLAVTGDTIVVRAELTSRAGTQHDILLPITVKLQ